MILSVKTVFIFKVKVLLNKVINLYKNFCFVAIALCLIIPFNVNGQKVIGKITRPGLKPWSIGVYEKGNKVFIGDKTTGNLLIFDGTSFELLDELTISGGCAGSSFCISEKTGKLYFCTFPSGRHVAVVDANTNKLLKYLPIDGYVPEIDEELGQVYIVSSLSPYVLYVIDVETDEFVSVPLSSGSGLTSGDAVNPVTHEIFVGFLHGDSLDIINGVTLKRNTVLGKRGRHLLVNWMENKVYRELVTFDGSWVYDRDDGTNHTIQHENDAAPAVYNPVNNKIYTTAEVENRVIIIDGKSNTYSNVQFPTAAFSPLVNICTNRIFFAGNRAVYILDGYTNMLKEILIENPNPSSGLLTDIAINHQSNYIFVINDGDALDFVTVIKDVNETDQYINICEGESAFIHGKYESIPGTYIDTLISNYGCDSIITTYLTANPIPDRAGTITGQTMVTTGQNEISYNVPVIPNATSYIWSLPTGATGSSATNMIKVNFGMLANSGTISVKGYNTCGDGKVSSLYIHVNNVPFANAGSDQSVNEGAAVSLDGSASSDPDGNPLTYNWTAPAGITLSSTTAQKPTFIAPEVSANTNYTFSLVVNDGITDSQADSVSVSVLNIESCIKNDSLALVAFYHATGGPNWTRNDNWLTGPVNTWYGVTTDGCNVTEIQLLANNLIGNLPPEIGNLKGLKTLSLADNLITGNIPVEIGQLTNLTYLRFWNNQLSGNIPSEIGQLTNLIILDIGPNKLTGNIPPEIGQLINLKDLNIQDNILTGTIPKEIGQLTGLTYLSFWNNQLTGNIPDELGQLINLTTLDLSHNQLTGSIPSGIWDLTLLQTLGLTYNQLSGTIPPEVGQLINLRSLYLGQNQLSGVIPVEIGQLINLTHLTLNGNQLSGTIIPELGQLINLAVLDISGNQLTGNIPVEIGLLKNLSTFIIQVNQLSGPIPPEFGLLTNLSYACLSYNQLSGSLPSEIGQLTNLTALDLNDNQLSGIIPAEISLLGKLQHLLIANNFFEEIPDLPEIDLQISTSNNLLTFEDFERNLDQIGKEGLSFTYIPQQLFGRECDTTATENTPFILSIPCGGKYNHYQWFKDGIQIPTAPDASKLAFINVQLSDSGIYHVTVTNDSIPDLLLQSKPVELSVALNQSPVANAGSDQTVDEGATVTLDGSLSTDPDVNPLTYKWTAPEGITLSSTTAQKPTFTAPEVTRDSIISFSLIVNDGVVNSLLDSVNVTVLNVIKVGIIEIERAMFKIYPNPSTGEVNYEIEKMTNEEAGIVIYNSLGEKVWQKRNIKDVTGVIDLSRHVSGIYFIRFNSLGETKTTKLILRRD